jgi:hypothetical protein
VAPDFPPPVQLESTPMPERPTNTQVAVVVENVRFMVYSFNSRWQSMNDQGKKKQKAEIAGNASCFRRNSVAIKRLGN